MKKLIPLLLILLFFIGGGYYLYELLKDDLSFVASSKSQYLQKQSSKNVLVINSKYTVSGKIDKNILLINSKLYLKKDADIKGSIFSWKSYISAVKGSSIAGDVFAMDSGVKLKSKKILEGNKYLVGSNSLSLQPIINQFIQDKPLLKFFGKTRFGMFLTIFCFSFLYLFFPKQFLKVAYTVYANPFSSLCSGVFGLLLTALLLLLLALSIIGIYLIVPFLLVLMIVFLQSIVGVAIVFGKFFRKKLFIKKNIVWLEILLGLIFIWAIRLIPEFGKYIYALLVLVGMGASFKTILGSKEN